MSESEPIAFRPRAKSGAPAGGAVYNNTQGHSQHAVSATYFNRRELNEILAVYGRMVAAGAWRDYAIDMGREKAVFSVFRRTSEFPLYRIEKNPKLARKQGAYSVVTATGLILKRGPDLKHVLAVFEKNVRLVDH